MGSWDCYCAVCGGPMTSVGRRLECVREENERSTKATTNDPSILPDDDGAYNLTEKELDWVTDCRVLGLNPNAPGPDKAFISGHIQYEDYGMMGSRGETEDENIEREHYVCYGAEDLDDGEEPAIPLHWDCYQLLCAVLTGSDDLSRVNKDVLYKAMMSATHAYSPCLGVEYDEPGAQIGVYVAEQFWNSFAGEELLVTSPLPPRTVSEDTGSMLEKMARMPALDSRLSAKVKSDPFGRLPRIASDIVLHLLDHDSLVNLLLASWCLHSSTHNDNGFWKMRIKKHLPWFMEVDHLFQAHNAPEGAMKALYLWAQTATLARPHIKKPLRAIVARRRVWYVCEQIRELYLAAFEE